MSTEQDNSPAPISLVEAVRKVRLASADKSDVVVEMREAAQARLELLAQDLQPVIDDVPADDERFDFALSSGLQPRFWIDATAHVMMGPDRRTYRFVRDTRLGRVLLGESADRAEIAENVVSYIAMQIHERELAFAGDLMSYRDLRSARAIEHDAGAAERKDDPDNRIDRAVAALREGDAGTSADAADTDAGTAPAAPAPAETVSQGEGGVMRAIAGGFLWILLGAVIGGGTLLLVYRDVLLQP